ncbi:MAG: hypothetical protein ACLSVX_12375 [Massilimicrobiota timonensis]
MLNFIYAFFSKFTISNWLEFIGIIASLITSIVAIWISVKTLKQNNQMIEESTRPYITITGKMTNFQNQSFYLVLKNYGSSGATITKFTCNENLTDYVFDSKYIPFENMCGTFIAPNQSFISNLNTHKLFAKKPNLIFEIEYESQTKHYIERFEISINSYCGLTIARADTTDKELKTISYVLQDLVEKQL